LTLGHGILRDENLVRIPRPVRRRQALYARRGRRLFRRTLLAVLIVLAGGGTLPHLVPPRIPAPGATPSDAVFVLVGGDNRIAAGYRAWQEGRGKDLYILGAGKDTRLEQILPKGALLDPAGRRRIHLERWSENTLENAFSAKSLVRKHGYRMIVLVTSDYHVPRARFAIHKVVPRDVSVTVLPVRSDWSVRGGLFRTARLFFIEGWKYWGYRLFLLWE
jgi:uncharacterized SAM-binding protein YcdF (DUF218 family)